MKDLESLKFEVWCDFPSDERNPPREMVSIRGRREENAEGLRYIWYVLTSTEFKDLLTGKQTTAEDGYHKVVVHGDSWLFYDTEALSGSPKKFGNLSVPFYRANMPHTFMKAMFRLCRRKWNSLTKAYKECMAAKGNKYDLQQRIEIEIPQAHRERVERLYGQGLGDVVIDFGDWKAEETMKAWETNLSNASESFVRCVDRLKCIARNQTWGFHQKAKVYIFKDGTDFSFSIHSPSGKRVMNGGLINHSRDGGNDWSTHT